MGRGVLTPDIITMGTSLGTPIFTRYHLRLLPYIQNLVLDHGKLDPSKIISEERQIISKWREDGLLTGGASDRVRVTREFWNVMEMILWYAYASAE